MQLLQLSTRSMPQTLHRAHHAFGLLGATLSLLLLHAFRRWRRGDFWNVQGERMPCQGLLELLRRWISCTRTAVSSLDWAINCRQRHGDIWRHAMGVTVASPAVARHLIASNWPRAQGSTLRRALLFQHLQGHTSPSVEHDAWHAHKNLATAAWSDSDLAGLCRAIFRYAGAGLAHQWVVLLSNRSSAVVDAGEWMTRVTLYITGCIVLGRRFDAMMADHKQAGPYVKALTQGLRLAAHPVLQMFPWLRRAPLARRRFAQADLSLLKAFVLQTLQEKQAEAKEKQRMDSASEEGNDAHNATPDLMDFVVKDNTAILNDEVVARNAMDLLLEGQSFSGYTLSCTLALLGTHPEVQMRARAEIRSSFPGQRCEDLPLECLDRLGYLTAVIKETLRLYPPASSLAPRVCPLDGEELAGYKIPKGTLVDVSVHAMHRNPQHWSRPNDFDPGRFFGDSGHVDSACFNATALQGCAGFGPEGCIGCQLAWIKMRLFLAVLLQNFTWRVPQGHELNLDRYSPQDCIPLIIARAVPDENAVGQEQAEVCSQANQQSRALRQQPSTGIASADWTSAEMVHGPMMIAWSFVPDRLQSRSVCAHWHFGCSTSELRKWRTGGRKGKSSFYSAKTSDGLVKGAKADSQGSRISLLMSLAGLFIGCVDFISSTSKLKALVHILVLYVFILLISSHISARLHRAGLYQRLEKGHWMFDGTCHWVVMLGLLFLLILANLVLPQTHGIVQLCPTFRLMPVLLFALGCFINSTVTKYDFHKFVAARTGREIKVSTIRLPKGEKAVGCPVCYGPACRMKRTD